MSQSLPVDLREALAPVVQAAGLYLEDVAVAGTPPKRVVTVTVDLADGPGGVDSDALGEVSRSVSAALDEHEDVLPGSYLLEVTTPGVSRPLTEPRHFRRAQGRLVRLSTTQGQVRGRLLAADDGGLRIAPTPTRSGAQPPEQTVPWAHVQQGSIDVEFSRD